MQRLIKILLITWTGLVSADELRWGFASADGMPYVDVHQQQLRGGVIYKLGMQASRELGYKATFVETPNKRINEYMQRGRIHVICNNNPQWIDKPERFHWSAPLYSEEDVLLVHREHAPLNDLQSLYGKTLGTQLGYIYSNALMAAFSTQEIIRKDVRDQTAGLNLVRKKRLDALIDMRRPLQHQLTKHPGAALQINPWVIDRYDMHCTYSPLLPVSADALDKTLQQLRDQGMIERMLNGS